MEKIVYVLWRDSRSAEQEFAELLRIEVAPRLVAAGARGVRLSVADEVVRPAAALRQANTQPAIDGLLSLWVDSAIERFRRPFDDLVEAAAGRLAAYLVTESQPIVNTRHPPVAGERTTGFTQLAFLRRPLRLTHEAWLDIWHNHHTQVAIETQDTFEYVQNVVVRSLSHDAPGFDAIVEESFPTTAMTDPQVFFDAAGDEARLQRHVREMMASCARFIDFDAIDVVPASQYVIKPA